jgi:hypothetical protein
MQWGVLTEEKQKSQLSHPEFRFIKTIYNNVWGAAIT